MKKNWIVPIVTLTLTLSFFTLARGDGQSLGFGFASYPSEPSYPDDPSYPVEPSYPSYVSNPADSDGFDWDTYYNPIMSMGMTGFAEPPTEFDITINSSTQPSEIALWVVDGQVRGAREISDPSSDAN